MTMLIKDEGELKGVLGGVQQTITWETMQPFVKQAEMDYILPAIGEAFYDELCGLETPNEPQIKILDRLKITSGYYALTIGLPQLLVAIGDMGAALNLQGGMAAMPKWTFSELMNSSIKKADKSLEGAMTWLEKNKDLKVDNQLVFQTWIGSEVYTISNSLFINSATELTEFFPNVQNSRRLYLILRNYIKKVEEYQLKPVLGVDFFNAIKQPNNTDSAENQGKKEHVLQLIKYFIANKAFSEALPFLNINEDFTLVTKSDGVSNEAMLDQNRRDGLKVNCDDNALIYLNKLKSFLDKEAKPASRVGAGVFSEYFNSEQYKLSKASKPYQRKMNDPTKPYVVF
jgi:hypothetical protein